MGRFRSSRRRGEGGSVLARGQGAALWADLHSSIYGSFRLATPLRPTGSAVRAFGAGFYPRPEGRGFHRASLARGERFVGEDSIFPTLHAMGLREGWGTRPTSLKLSGDTGIS